jgi:hypothetical protein
MGPSTLWVAEDAMNGVGETASISVTYPARLAQPGRHPMDASVVSAQWLMVLLQHAFCKQDIKKGWRTFEPQWEHHFTAAVQLQSGTSHTC